MTRAGGHAKQKEQRGHRRKGRIRKQGFQGGERTGAMMGIEGRRRWTGRGYAAWKSFEGRGRGLDLAKDMR